MSNQETGRLGRSNPAEGMLQAVGWGSFLVWLGIAFLFGIPEGIALLGIGLITLGVQAARLAYRLRLEGFWVGVGLLFLVGGIWELAQIQQPLVPILLVLVGAVIIISGFVGKRAIWQGRQDDGESE
jgi:hypothetical protein